MDLSEVFLVRVQHPKIGKRQRYLLFLFWLHRHFHLEQDSTPQKHSTKHNSGRITFAAAGQCPVPWPSVKASVHTSERELPNDQREISRNSMRCLPQEVYAPWQTQRLVARCYRWRLAFPRTAVLTEEDRRFAGQSSGFLGAFRVLRWQTDCRGRPRPETHETRVSAAAGRGRRTDRCILSMRLRSLATTLRRKIPTWERRCRPCLYLYSRRRKPFWFLFVCLLVRLFGWLVATAWMGDQRRFEGNHRLGGTKIVTQVWR